MTSISIIIPTLNEAGNIEAAVQVISKALQEQNLHDFEMIIVDAGSTDGTGAIIDELSKKNERIKALHSPVRRGLGYDFRMGASIASKDYIGWFPGDNETLPETMTNIFKQIGQKDIIIPYTANPWVRPLYRRSLSKIYTLVFNIIFGLRLKYFNGPSFFRREIFQKAISTTNSPAFMAETLVQLLKKGEASYVEVPMFIKTRDYGKTSVLSWKYILPIGKTIVNLICKVYFQK
jgi:glycosyltransferase involved in cell wall biosynthesis